MIKNQQFITKNTSTGLNLLIYKENKKLSTEKNAIYGKNAKSANRFVKTPLQFVDSISDNKGAVSRRPSRKAVKTSHYDHRDRKSLETT